MSDKNNYGETCDFEEDKTISNKSESVLSKYKTLADFYEDEKEYIKTLPESSQKRMKMSLFEKVMHHNMSVSPDRRINLTQAMSAIFG